MSLSPSNHRAMPLYGVWSFRSLIVHFRSETRPGYTACGIDHRDMTEVTTDRMRICKRCREAAR